MTSPFAADGTLPGTSGEATRVVGENDTAIAAGSGDLSVLATPVLIALMEAAACNALIGRVPRQMTTVGSHIDVRHLAPSPLGVSVTAHATIIEVSGSKVAFTVSATHDVDGRAVDIGRGTHVRVLVDRDTFGRA